MTTGKAPVKPSNIPAFGAPLDVDQLRTIINSLNVLAEQEEGEYLLSRFVPCVFTGLRELDRLMWEAVGSTPPFGEHAHTVHW